jgi:hypothetical protein
MPAVRDLLATINQFALARLPGVASWCAAGAEASPSFRGGRGAAPAGPERAALPESKYAHAGPEPPLDEVLGDPLVQLIMQADHVQPADVRRLRSVIESAPVGPTHAAPACAR